MPKFIPLAFLISLTIFITNHLQDSEFTILWSSGVKKTKIVHLLFYISTIVFLIYLSLSLVITPYFLNKSRQLLSNDKVNSFLPTIKKNNLVIILKTLLFLLIIKIIMK